MAKTVNELLGEALTEVQASAIDNIVHSKNIKPQHRTLLIKNGYLKTIIKGWYLLDADLSTQKAGESALWYESVWSFIGQYLFYRFDDNYWLGPEASLNIHTDNNSMPPQIVVFVKGGTEDIAKLPNNMSIMVTRSNAKPDGLVEHRGVNVYSLEAALVNSVPIYYKNNQVSILLALKNADLDKLAEAMLRSKNITSAGRIIGAYEALEMRAESKKLEIIMTGVFENIKVKNPFADVPIIFREKRKEAASASRIRIMWQQMRQVILERFEKINPEFNFYSIPIDETLNKVNEIYVNDAYNSLSIEGYKVTPELIERVSHGDWSPETIEQDKVTKDTLAARGYYDAFNTVKESLTEAHKKEDISYLVDVGITAWSTALFTPCVAAGIISEINLAGYRKGPIYIRGSRHVPPASEQLMDCMTALKECIAEEESFAVKAVLGHLFFGYVHPYFDGNGRTARFLMNFLFIIGGYKWVVIKLETREEYLAALESASVGKDITQFADFILDTIK
ncbi:MAG: Fic family protein, partial [Candidatus Scalindua sp.]